DRQPEALADAIERCRHDKARVVAADEREGGQRAILNLGHTFGHAIETAMGYGAWLHGEAVAAGMVMALDLSVRLGWIAWVTVERFLELMAVDKKVLDGRLRLVLLRNIGEAVATDEAPRSAVCATLEAARAAA